MAISTGLKAALNKAAQYIPALRKDGEAAEIKLGDLLDVDAKIVAIKEVTLAAAATTVVAVPGALTTDSVFASIRLPNTGASIATNFTKVHLATAGNVTLTPNVTPTTADGIATIIVVRAVTAAA